MTNLIDFMRLNKSIRAIMNRSENEYTGPHASVSAKPYPTTPPAAQIPVANPIQYNAHAQIAAPQTMQRGTLQQVQSPRAVSTSINHRPNDNV